MQTVKIRIKKFKFTSILAQAILSGNDTSLIYHAQEN